jgi:hypothetical protein
METYNKSILEYDDVRSAVNFAAEKAAEKATEIGKEIGKEELIITGRRNGFQVSQILKFTGFSEAQIMDILKRHGLS